jgi:hypothetical protein
MIIKNKIWCLAASVFVLALSIGFSTGASAQEKKAASLSYVPGTRSDLAVKPSIVSDSFNRLGYKVEYHKDAMGRPHLVVLHSNEAIKGMAVFFNGCHLAGCEDVTLYADFGSVPDFGFAEANRWNHPNDRLRSKIFVSTETEGDPVGISMTVSFLNESNADQMDWNVGLFLLEAEIFVARHLKK